MPWSEGSGGPRRRSTALIALGVALAVTVAVTARVGIGASARHAPRAHADHGPLSVLQQTLIRAQDSVAVDVPTLRDTDGAPFGAERLRGRWSLIAVGFTSCPDVCSITLQVLSGVARHRASGVAAGTTQIVFVSVDPEGDTPQRVKRYLQHFDSRIVGLVGSRDPVARFTAAIGAAYQRSDSGIDHSTSVFVIDPAGRRAGILLRPADPDRIVSDLEILRAARASHAQDGRASSARQ
jgi:protein SCO1/2